MRQFILCLLTAALCPSAFAQQKEALQVLNKIRSFYTGTETKHMKGEMLLQNLSNNAVEDRVEFEYWSSGNKLFSRMSYIEILQNDSVYLMVNHKQKTLLARRLTQKMKRTSAVFDITQLQELLQQQQATVQLEVKDSVKKLVMSKLQTSRFSSLSIQYHPVDFRILSIEALVRPQPGTEPSVLRIHYRLTEKSKNRDTGNFRTSRYIERIAGKTFHFNKKYQDYKKI